MIVKCKKDIKGNVKPNNRQQALFIKDNEYYMVDAEFKSFTVYKIIDENDKIVSVSNQNFNTYFYSQAEMREFKLGKI